MSTPLTCTCPGGSPLLAAGLDAPCPCTYHRRYADLYAADPATWGPKMVATARFRLGLPAVPVPARGARPAPERLTTPSPFPRHARPRRPGEPVRVLFWVPAFYRGGAERWHLDLIRRLDPTRVRAPGVVINRRDLTDADMVAELRGLAAVGHGPTDAVEWARGADVVVTWGPLPRAALAMLNPRPPVVTVSHGDSHCPYTTGWVADAAPMTDHFVAVAAVGLETIPPPSRTKATVLHNGADSDRVIPSRARAEARAAWGVPEGAKVLGYLGRFATSDKRADLVAGVAAHLPEDWWVVLVGDGWAARQIAEMAARTPRTILAPWVERSGDALVGFDLLTNPSAVEGFGLSQVEAMLAGIPVVGTATGIAAERPDLLSGRIATDATADQLAAEVLRVAADPATAGVVAHARVVASDRFTAAAFADRWMDYLEGLAPAVPATTSVAASSRATATAPMSAPAPKRSSLADQRALVAECDYRGHVLSRPSCGCQSEVRYCGLGKGFFPAAPHEVRFSDCLACIKEN